MVRYSTKSSGISSENLIVVSVLALAVILFLAIVLWPSGSKPGAALQSVSATPLALELNDAETVAYLTVLQRVAPAAARDLHKQAETAITSGADKNDLALLVLGAVQDDLENAQDVFFKADVKYFDKILNVTKTGLARLSAHAPKFCRISHYEALSTSGSDAEPTEILALLDYDSAGYKFALELNQVLLEGIEDGRKSPNNYGRLTSKDEQAFQALMMRMMANSKVANAMRIQSMPPAQQKRAFATLNICDLSNEVISGVQGLPQDTKKRLMGEMSRIAKRGELDGPLKDMGLGL